MQIRIRHTLAILSVAFATQAPAAVLEEVIVTAQKRGEQDIQSLATSVFALGGDELEDKGNVDFESFAGSVPGLQFQDLGPGDKEYIIRGINGNGPAVVGAYFDEYVISANDQQDGGGKNAPIKLVDLERIEVLNGPQGTLYGANSMAGNIRFIPRKPDMDELGGFANADISDTDEGGFNYTLSGALNVPIIEGTLAARVAAWRSDSDGWIDQPRREVAPGTYGLVEDINAEETNGVRLMLRWTPNDRITFDGLVLYQDMDVDGSSRFTAAGGVAWPDQSAAIAALPFPPPAPLAGLPSLTTTRDFQNTDITVNTRDDEVKLFGGTLGYDAGFGTFSVAASYYEHNIDFVFDSTPILLFFGAPVPGVTVQPQSYETTMVETRFASDFDGPFNFVAGLYYQKDENDFEVRVTTTDGAGGVVAWNPLASNDTFINGGTAIFGRFRNDEYEQYAVFGEATYEFMEKWELLVGFRYFDAQVEARQATTHGFFNGVSTAAGTPVGTTVNGNVIGLLEQGDSTTRPKVSLSYDVNEDIMLYALYSEGFRVGGINNANQPFASGIPATFDSDELTNYEIGIKSIWLDQRLQINATAFWMDWDDIQVEPRDPAGNIPFTTNGGAAEVNGLEWAMSAFFTERFRVDFTGTYFFDSQLTQNQPVLPGASPAVIVGLNGDDLPNVPELQLFVSAMYEAVLMDRPLRLLADLTYRDETNTEFRPDSPFNINLDSYTVINLFANYELTNNITVGAYVKNVTNELAVYDGIGTFQDPQAIVANRPLTFGGTVRWDF